MKSQLVLSAVAFAMLLHGCSMPKSSYKVVKAPVLKVYTTTDGPYRFVAYMVNRNGVEVIVSDPLGRSRHKVGDTITYLDQKLQVDANTSVINFMISE